MMDLKTISDMVDIQLNSLGGGVYKDEYEKSVYLTAAQDMFYNTLLDSFESTHSISMKLARLVKDEQLVPVGTTVFGGNIITFTQPIKAILKERVDVTSSSELYNGRELEVHTERLAEIEESLRNPFRRPNGNKILRALTELENTYINKVELYSMAPIITINTYKATVAVRANPIILEDVTSSGLEIDGSSAATTYLSFEDDDIKTIIKLAVTSILQDIQILAGQKQE